MQTSLSPRPDCHFLQSPPTLFSSSSTQDQSSNSPKTSSDCPTQRLYPLEDKDLRDKFPILKCDFCSYQTTRSYHLKQHIRRHTGEKPYSCPHCSKSFSMSQTLVCHIRTHTGEKPYACPHCPYRAIQSTNLKAHIRSIHPAGGDNWGNTQSAILECMVSGPPILLCMVLWSTNITMHGSLAHQYYYAWFSGQLVLFCIVFWSANIIYNALFSDPAVMQNIVMQYIVFVKIIILCCMNKFLPRYTSSLNKQNARSFW